VNKRATGNEIDQYSTLKEERTHLHITMYILCTSRFERLLSSL
jgi:hypothetical protein